jgi:hypothetical protein
MPRGWFFRKSSSAAAVPATLITTDLNAVLQKEILRTTSLDGLIINEGNLVASLDGILKAVDQTVTASLNAQLSLQSPAAPPTIVATQLHEAMGGNKGWIRIARPNNLQSQDLLIAHIAMDNSANDGILHPPGWTELDERIDDASQVRHWLGYLQIEAGSPDASPEWFTWFLNSATEFGVGALVHIQDYDKADPIDASGFSASASANATVTLTAISPSHDNTGLLEFVAADNNAASSLSNDDGSPIIEIVNQDAGGTAGAMQGIAYEPRPLAGTTGDRTWTLSSADDWVGGLVAVLGDNGGAFPTEPTRVPATAPVIAANESGTAVPGTSISINKPTGTAEGELLLAHIVSDGNVTITPPGGSPIDEEWTTLYEHVANGSVSVWCGYKIANEAEPSSYTWGVSASEIVVGELMRITGFDTSSPGPIEAVTSATSSGAQLWALCDSATPRADSNLLISLGASDKSTADEIHLWENNETELVNTFQGGTPGVWQVIGHEIWHAEATGKRVVRVNAGDDLSIGMVIIAAAQS